MAVTKENKPVQRHPGMMSGEAIALGQPNGQPLSPEEIARQVEILVKQMDLFNSMEDELHLD